ncbi:uncharacterized protein LOC126803570 [Argentina anserina]|uniref:uncharacterized protein LOC126803570 n=1 Tax=Argentina anserina TaxID=57926 RepID=UPI002176223E|nr:uncharacterized protein LOC126803570 [Potentilla anserina]
MWSPPDTGNVKINFDGSVINNSTTSGFVFRDHNSRTLFTAARKIGDASVPVAEALALRYSLLLARDRGFRHIEVEGDSKLVIGAVNGNVKFPWKLRSLIQDIKTIANNFEVVVFKHVLRDANFVANAIASVGHSCTNDVIWNDFVPNEACNAFFFYIVNVG